jgi:hypothetical protein
MQAGGFCAAGGPDLGVAVGDDDTDDIACRDAHALAGLASHPLVPEAAAVVGVEPERRTAPDDTVGDRMDCRPGRSRQA